MEGLPPSTKIELEKKWKTQPILWLNFRKNATFPPSRWSLENHEECHPYHQLDAVLVSKQGFMQRFFQGSRDCRIFTDGAKGLRPQKKQHIHWQHLFQMLRKHPLKDSKQQSALAGCICFSKNAWQASPCWRWFSTDDFSGWWRITGMWSPSGIHLFDELCLHQPKINILGHGISTSSGRCRKIVRKVRKGLQPARKHSCDHINAPLSKWRGKSGCCDAVDMPQNHPPTHTHSGNTHGFFHLHAIMIWYMHRNDLHRVGPTVRIRGNGSGQWSTRKATAKRNAQISIIG